MLIDNLLHLWWHSAKTCRKNGLKWFEVRVGFLSFNPINGTVVIFRYCGNHLDRKKLESFDVIGGKEIEHDFSSASRDRISGIVTFLIWEILSPIGSTKSVAKAFFNVFAKRE